MNERHIVIIYKLLNFSWFAIPAIIFSTPLITDRNVSLGLFIVSLCILIYSFSKFEKKYSDIIKKTVIKRYQTINLALCFVLFITFNWGYNHHVLKSGSFAALILLLALLSIFGDIVLLKITLPFRKKSV
jgi:hypothetical protein